MKGDSARWYSAVSTDTAAPPASGDLLYEQSPPQLALNAHLRCRRIGALLLELQAAFVGSLLMCSPASARRWRVEQLRHPANAEAWRVILPYGTALAAVPLVSPLLPSAAVVGLHNHSGQKKRGRASAKRTEQIVQKKR